jgi:hypothetical protein
MFERTLDEPGLQSIEIERGRSTKLQVSLHLELMIRLSPPPAGLQGEHTRINLKLLGHERDNLVWDRLEVVRDKAEIPLLPTSPRESQFSLAYSHPYAGNPMTWRVP